MGLIHVFFLGLILGWGAAIPLGPINFEIMRRNLNEGMFAGIALGFGASTADLTYFILLSLGILTFLNQPILLKTIGFISGFVLLWFAYGAFRLKTNITNDTVKDPKSHHRHLLEGFLLTLVNPYTIIFWCSLSSTIALTTQANKLAVLMAGIGVLVGVVSWVFVFNYIIHRTRHFLPANIMHKLNISGGVILLLFACYSFYRVLS